MVVDSLIRRFPLRAAAAAAAAVALLLQPGVTATPLYPEVLVTSAPIPDYEFDWGSRGSNCPTCNFGEGNAQLTFSDNEGNLWLAKVDYDTGNFIPSNGRGVQLDGNTAKVADFGNGPEWVASKNGSQIVYTRYTDGLPPSPETAQIAVLTRTASGWTKEILPNSLQRATPSGSTDLEDADPRINYVESTKEAVYWRRLSDPGTEVDMQISEVTGGNSRRWIPGTRKIVFQGHDPADRRLLDQVFVHDTDRPGSLEKLTTDNVSKASAFMWRAPEFGNEFVFFTMANFRQEIWVYRELPVPGSTRKQWTVVKKVLAPPNPSGEAVRQFFWSPEPFVHNGRSYIFTQVGESSRFFDRSKPTHLAIMGIDPLRNDFRMLTQSGSNPERVRLDPEVFITSQGPFVYYNRLIPATSSDADDAQNDGTWRVNTGLGPPRF